MEPDQAHFHAAVRRIVRWSGGLAAGGGLLCWMLRGWKWAAAFVLGAAAGYLNFRWLKRIVDALGAASEARPRARYAIFIGLRYLFLAAGAYAILNLTNLSLPAALIGLFVPVAAVILEIIFELIYASR